MKNLDFSTREARQKFYQSKEWRTIRDFMLYTYPLCARCMKEDKITSAAVVHHIREIKDAPHLRLDPSNLECLCKECHDKLSFQDAAKSTKDFKLLNRQWELQTIKLKKPRLKK